MCLVEARPRDLRALSGNRASIAREPDGRSAVLRDLTVTP